jgi:hypothetical protein
MVHQDDYGDLPGFILLLYSKLEEGWNGKHYSWNGSTLQNIKTLAVELITLLNNSSYWFV